MTPGEYNKRVWKQQQTAAAIRTEILRTRDQMVWERLEGDPAGEIERRALVYALEDLVKSSAKTSSPAELSKLLTQAQRLAKSVQSLPGYIPF